MLVGGALLALCGLVLALTVGGEAPGGWLLPVGLLTGGAGVVLAGVLARVRRRAALVRGVVRAHRTAADGPARRLAALPRMIRDSARGRNPVLPRYQVLLWLLAAIYLVWPLDFVPDVLFLLGVADDIGVGAWLVTSLYAETGNYLAQRDDSTAHPSDGAST